MKRYRTFTVIGLMAALLLSSCSQEELGEQGMALPEGEYPLQIGSVTLTAEVSEQPWTRVSESPADGMSSVWEGNEQIGVQIGRGQPGIYTVQADGSVVAENPVYWTSTTLTYVNAWYPTNETVDLSNQSNGLAYVLNAIQDYVTYDQPVTLNFTHQLAKVRVVLGGTQAGQVESVEIYGITACNHLRGTLDYEASNTGWIKIVVPGEVISQIKVNNTEATLTKPLTPKVAALNTINLTVGEKITDINKDNTTISDNGYYRVSGTFDQPITITGGKPTIYLENANISVGSGPAISITDGNPTIYVSGNNSIVSNYNNNKASGIYVATGSSLTISGNNMEEDVLRVTGATDGAAIGGYSTGYDQHTNCGSITISNVTVYAETCVRYMDSLAPGIGSTGNTCGTITITNAIVHARSNGDATYSAPAIGAYGSVPEIVITDSEIHAYRGSGFGTSYADYIGRGGSMRDYQGGQIQCGSGSITGSTVYKYTYNYSNKSSSNDGSEAY